MRNASGNLRGGIRLSFPPPFPLLRGLWRIERSEKFLCDFRGGEKEEEKRGAIGAPQKREE